MRVELTEAGTGIHFPGWMLHDWTEVEELLAFRDEQRRLQPGRQILFSLDDGRDSTTCLACERHGLLDIPEDQLTEEERRRWQDYERGSELPAERIGPFLVDNLKKKVAGRSFDGFQGRLHLQLQHRLALHQFYDEPLEVFGSKVYQEGWVRMPRTRCSSIQSFDPSMALAVQPNGYWGGDLDPMENYLLAEHLRTTFGYELLGLGDFLCAYVRPEPPSRQQAEALVASVRGMYTDLSDDTAELWVEAAVGRRWFLLSYCGS